MPTPDVFLVSSGMPSTSPASSPASTADFPARLAAAVSATGAPLCVGLDPDPARLPSGTTLADFSIAITESTAPFAAAFKPNLAFFEAAGLAGWQALEEVCAAVRATGRLLVLDAKRGDIDSTAARYATALFDHLGGDAATVSPYLGRDSIAPFLQHAGRCSFVLAATSNPGASDLQALDV
ncbi:MAG TPA: orotidine-5'-phosphate decarboxylase, partial [Rhodothermales bacterium]|nr:orotidine-5'-phosphate decarboxylase [Rhodothermales bacterium]